MLEMGGYCGKSAMYLGAAAREPAAWCSPSTTTGARRRTSRAGSTTTPTLVDPAAGPRGHPAALPAHHRGAGLEDVVVAVVGRSATVAAHWRTPLALLFIDGGHAEEARAGRLRGLRAPACARRRCW